MQSKDGGLQARIGRMVGSRSDIKTLIEFLHNKKFCTKPIEFKDVVSYLLDNGYHEDLLMYLSKEFREFSIQCHGPKLVEQIVKVGIATCEDGDYDALNDYGKCLSLIARVCQPQESLHTLAHGVAFLHRHPRKISYLFHPISESLMKLGLRCNKTLEKVLICVGVYTAKALESPIPMGLEMFTFEELLILDQQTEFGSLFSIYNEIISLYRPLVERTRVDYQMVLRKRLHSNDPSIYSKRDALILAQRNLVLTQLVNTLKKPLSQMDLKKFKNMKFQADSISLVNNIMRLIYQIGGGKHDMLMWNEYLDKMELSNNIVKVFEKYLKGKKTPENPYFCPTALLNYFYLMFINTKPDSNVVDMIFRPNYSTLFCKSLNLFTGIPQLTMDNPYVEWKVVTLSRKFLSNGAIPHFATKDDQHVEFVNILCSIISSSLDEAVQIEGYEALKAYICSFPDRGRYCILTRLITNLDHPNLLAFLIYLCKDMIKMAYSNRSNDREKKGPLFFEFTDHVCGEDNLSNLVCTICKVGWTCKEDFCEFSEVIFAILSVLSFMLMFDPTILKTYFLCQLYLQDDMMSKLKATLHELEISESVPMKQSEITLRYGYLSDEAYFAMTKDKANTTSKRHKLIGKSNSVYDIIGAAYSRFQVIYQICQLQFGDVGK